MSELLFSASMARGEAVLRFPYDERLRQLLRAIPGRRWDPDQRVWCLPLEHEQAEALARTTSLRLSDAASRALLAHGGRAASAAHTTADGEQTAVRNRDERYDIE